MTRSEEIFENIQRAIREGELPAGYQATEPELATKFGVSRATLREALVKLEGKGTIEIIPRRGIRVLPLTIEDLQEIYEILTFLEPQVAATVAARKHDAKTLKPLEQAMTDMESSLKANDLDAWAEADERFHFALLDLHGNARLSQFVSILYDQAHRARMVTLRLRALPVQSSKEHREIFTAIKKGDPKACMSAFVAHRGRAAEELVSVLKQSGIRQL